MCAYVYTAEQFLINLGAKLLIMKYLDAQVTPSLGSFCKRACENVSMFSKVHEQRVDELKNYKQSHHNSIQKTEYAIQTA